MGKGGILRFLGNRLVEIILVVLLIAFIPNIPPNAKYSKPYTITKPQPLEGKLALNKKLNDAEIWHKGNLLGPEAFAEYNGELYTSVHGGDVVKLSENHITPVVKFGKPCKGIYQEKLCGRPLGIHFDKNGALYVADAYYGIFKVDIKSGKKVQLVSPNTEIENKKPKLFNSVAIASNGDIYWTDSSTEFSLEDGFFDLFTDGSGRLIHYDAKLKTNKVLLNNLHFANGVMLSDDESFVIVAETARARIHRYYLKGIQKGTSDIFLDGLIGLPDNIQTDGKGGFLIPLVVPIDEQHPLFSSIFGPFPLIRKFISRLFGIVEVSFKLVDQIYPNEITERGIHYIGHFSSFTFLRYNKRFTLLHVSKDAEIVDCLHAIDSGLNSISEAFIYKNTLLLGSPFNNYVGRIPLAKVGLGHLAISTEKKIPVKSAEKVESLKPTDKAPPTTSSPVEKIHTSTETPKVTKEKDKQTASSTTKENSPKTIASPSVTKDSTTAKAPQKSDGIKKVVSKETPSNENNPKAATQENSAKKVPPNTTENNKLPKKTATKNTPSPNTEDSKQKNSQQVNSAEKTRDQTSKSKN